MKKIVLDGSSESCLYQLKHESRDLVQLFDDKKPILIHVHIYYHEMWAEIKEYLNNILSMPHHLYITMLKEDEALTRDALSIDSKADISVLPNRGFDVGPFFHVLNRVNLDDFSYLIKIHTKRDKALGALLGSYNVSGSKWREYALSFLKRDNLQKCIKSFDIDKRLGLVANYHLIVYKETTDLESLKQGNQYLDLLKLPNKSSSYVAGTMFMARAFLFKPIQKLKLSINDFNVSSREDIRSRAHIMERLIGRVIGAQGYKIEDVFSGRLGMLFSKLTTPFRYMGIFIYRAKVTVKGQTIVKICKIPIFKSKYNKQ